MKIAIIGTRGIPNHYGGFEQFAEYLALGLVKNEHETLVYNSHNHPYQNSTWMGVQIIHCFDPENKIGTGGQFIYDLNCIRDLKKRKVDIVLQLGYTSSSVWSWLMPREAIVTTNMDGLEWKRSKYAAPVKKFLLFAEKLAVKFSDYLISDSIGIQHYLSRKYAKNSTYIPYGAHLFNEPNEGILNEFDLDPFCYDMLIARLEPENSVEVILQGVVLSETMSPFLVIGNHNTLYGKYLKNEFKKNPNIKFIGAIYDLLKLNNLRYYSKIYFHGHTVGGTNPSLLEAMASDSLICAHDNEFNRQILGEDAFYFRTFSDVSNVLKVSKNHIDFQNFIQNNRMKISEIYSWDKVINQYINHFVEILKNKTQKA